MSGARALYAYAWDLAGRPLGETLAELHSYGLNTLSLATSYHAGKFIRPRAGAGTVYFPQDGTVYFRARMERYGKLKPQLNSLLEEGDVLAELCEAQALAVTGWTVLLHNTRLGLEHPEATVCNACGDRYVYSLCPSNPEVREYAVALCQDLADAYALNGLALETPGFLPFSHGFHHEFAQLEQNPWLDTYLALCFCHHCSAAAQAAGIDAERLRRQTAAKLRGFFDSPVVADAQTAREWLLADFVAEPELGAFLRWRCEQVTRLVSEIRAALRADVGLAVIPTVQRPTAGTWLEGSDLAALGAAADALEVPFYEPSPQRIAADVFDVKRRAPAASVRAILRPGPPDMASAEQLTASIAALRAAGVDDLAFYNYGLLRRHHLGWLRSALLGD